MYGLLSSKGSYAVDCLIAYKPENFRSVSFSKKSYSYECPYNLPEITEGDKLVIVSGFLHELRRNKIDIEETINNFRKDFTKIFLIDHYDSFQLDFDEQVMSLFDSVMKVSGVYKDKDLYNFVVGSATSNGRWTEKVEPKKFKYSAKSIEKIYLSAPCILGTVPILRQKVRSFYNDSKFRRMLMSSLENVEELIPEKISVTNPPPKTVHFVGSLTHIQRAEATQKIKDSKLSLIGGITSIPNNISGFNGNGIAELSPSEKETLTKKLAPILIKPLNRLSYRSTMRQCKSILSITGYGEIAFRMAEAWSKKRVLVCQDVSHADIRYPLENGVNVVFCRPDLTDLIDILEDIECNFGKYVEIAERGYLDWQNYSTNWKETVEQSFLPIL